MSVSSSAAVDWARFLQRCTPVVRKKVVDLHARHEELRRLILEAQKTVPRLDFGAYRQKLHSAEDQAILDRAEQQVAGFQPTQVDVSLELDKLRAAKISNVRTVGTQERRV